MKIVKTFHQQNQMVTLRSDYNANDFVNGRMRDPFLLLVEEAKQDFPGLMNSEIMVEESGGMNLAGTHMIEFVRKDAPSEYERIEKTSYP